MLYYMHVNISAKNPYQIRKDGNQKTAPCNGGFIDLQVSIIVKNITLIWLLKELNINVDKAIPIKCFVFHRPPTYFY